MNRHFFLSIFVLAMLALLPLSGCGDTKAINEKLAETDEKTSAAMATFEAKPLNTSPLTVSKRPWYGAQAVSISSGVSLPSELTGRDSLTLTFDEPLSLKQTGNLIQSVTGIRVVVNQKSSAGEGGSGGFLPVNGREVRGSKVIWQGSLDDLLNQVADNFDAGWSYDGASIILDEELTKTFMLNSLSTVVSDTSKVESGGSGSSGGSSSGGSLPTVTTSGTTELKVWDEVKSVVDSIVTGRGRATYSPSTGTITVSGSPSAVRRVEDYLRFQNQLRLRRIAVSVKVLQLTLAQRVNTGLSGVQVLERIIKNSELNIETGSGGLTAGFIAGGSTAREDILATLQASKEVDRISVVNSGAVVTLSDQPAPLQIGRQVAYLARRSSTSGTDTSGGSETLEPGTVDLGLTMNILPRVIEDDRVILRLSLALTDAVQFPFRQFGDDGGSEQIELPEIATTGFQQNTVLANGETLVLAGFEKNENSIDDTGIPGFDAILGGQKNRRQSRAVTVMLITSNILPEDPITVYSENQ